MNRTAYFQSCLGVFQGGGCRAAAFAGAVDEVYRRGVYFAEIAGTSAGSIIAALIGAGASPDFILKALSALDLHTLIREPDPIIGKPTIKDRLLCTALEWTTWRDISVIIRHLGMHSSQGIEEWIDEQLGKLLPRVTRPVRFRDLPISTWIVATDLKRRQAKIWSKWDTAEEEVAPAVRASCSIPGFFQPVQARYVDGGVLSNLPAFVFYGDNRRQPLAKRALAFLLDADEQGEEPDDTASIARAVANTIVDGSRDIQLKLLPDVHVIRISTGIVKATDFDKMDQTVTRGLITAGQEAVKDFFDHEAERVRPARPSPSVCAGLEEMYAAVVENLDRAVREILIMDDKSDWAYALFPALIYWRSRGVRIRALIKRGSGDPLHGPYQRRLLRAMGLEMLEVENVPARGWLFDATEIDGSRAVIRCPDSSFGATAVRYAGRDDFSAISALRAMFAAACDPSGSENAMDVEAANPTLVRADEIKVRAALKRVPQYKSHECEIALRCVPLSHMQSLSRYVREYKFRQIARLITLYEDAKDLRLFEPAAFQYGNGKETIVTPPVVEQTGKDRFVLIEGTTRATYCQRQGSEELYCMVVSNPEGPLPSQREFLLKDVTVVGTTLPPSERYEGFNHQTFRRIEFAMHSTDSLQ